MNNTGVKIIAAFFAITIISQIPARAGKSFEDQYIIREISMEEGLPCDFIDDILIDDAGFVWVATSGGGLCRMDGYDILSFSASSTPALKSSFVRKVTEDSFGRLWVASEGGLDILNLKTLELADTGLDLPDNSMCYYVTTDSKGGIWAVLGASLWHITLDPTGKVESARSLTHGGIGRGNIVFEDVDSDGSIWICLDGRITKVWAAPDGSLSLQELFPQLDLGENTYVSDYLLSGDQLWISTENGLYLLYKPTGEWKRYVTDSRDQRSLTQNFVSSLAVTKEGRLLASTLHGLNVYNPLSDDFERIGQDVINGLTIYGNRILAGTETRGVLCYMPKTLAVRNYTHNESDPGSISGGAVNAVWQGHDGCLWVGAVEGGLSILEKGENSFRHLKGGPGGLSHNSVSYLEQAGKDRLYVGTWGGGIDIVSTQKPYRVISHVRGSDGIADYIGILQNDSRNGLLWVGSNRGIYMYSPTDASWTPALDEPSEGSIGSCLDSSGHLWVGSLHGLFVFDLNARGEDGRFPYIHYKYKLDAPETGIEEKISAITEIQDGVMCIGSNGGGFYIGRRQPGGEYTFTGYDTSDGLSNNRVRGICKDADGNIWISTGYGLNRFDAQNGSIVPFFLKDGLSGVRFHWNNSFEGTDGLLYFGHENGLSAINPEAYHPDNSFGPLRFTGISIGDETIQDSFLGKLTLHERDRNIQLRFAVLAPDATDGISYRASLEGFDKGWHKLERGEHSVSYSALPHGRFSFRVEAENSAGNTISTLTLPVEVKPYCQHTMWFKIIVIVVIAIMVWLFSWIRTRSLRRRQTILEETVKERTREISAQKKLVEEKAEELNRQNALLIRQNEELASQKILFQKESHKEDSFMEKALEVLRQYYKNPDLDVETFCRAMGMSKTSLNNRLQETAGMSIGQLIRTYRLSVASEMLENTTMNVSEVAYEVGFNDPKYFTRCFTKEFGKTPSSLAK